MFIVLAMVAGLTPAVTLLWVTRQRALARSEQQLTERVAAAATLLDRLLSEAEITLEQLALHAQEGVDEEMLARSTEIS